MFLTVTSVVAGPLQGLEPDRACLQVEEVIQVEEAKFHAVAYLARTKVQTRPDYAWRVVQR